MLTLFSIAFIFSFLGAIPPGAINLSVIQLAIEKRKIAALRFTFAAALVEFPYVLIAVKFENWITSSPVIIQNLKLISASVMLILAAINFISYFKNSPTSKASGSLKSGFRKGVIISILNPLVIPFWVGITAYLKFQQWIELNNLTEILIYAVGVSTGTFALLLLLLLLGGRIKLGFNHNRLVKLIPALVFLALGIYALSHIFFVA